jgi:hypothetical protein
VLLLVSGVLSAQEAEPEAQELGTDTAQQALQEVSISRFEDPGFWSVYVPSDKGVIQHRRLEGAPADKEPISAEQQADIDVEDQYVLGVKTQFFPPRSQTNIMVEPSRPLPVPGIAKTISVWVVGRNFNHRLSVLLRDIEGEMVILPMGQLNFSGWRKLTTAIPPTVRQQDIHYPHLSGVEIIGFMITPDLLESFGSYYVYFDALRVTTDLFLEESRDPDDMVDSW